MLDLGEGVMMTKDEARALHVLLGGTSERKRETLKFIDSLGSSGIGPDHSALHRVWGEVDRIVRNDEGEE